MGTVRTTAILVLVTGYAIFFSPLGCKKTTSLKGIGEKCGQSSECKSGLVCIDFACQLATSDMTQPDVTTTDTADAADTTVEDSADTTIDTVNDTEDSGGDTIVPTDSEDAADETTPDTADTTDTVVTGCTKHDDCPALQLCNFGNGTCIEPTVCFADEDCIQARVCADGYCDANYGGCTQATECTPTGGTCDPVAHQCVDNNDKDASGECKTDDDCIGNRRCVLVTTKKRCRDCSSSPDCPFNATCNANFCENFQYPAITPDDCESNNTPQTAKLVDSECNLGSDKTIDATDEDWYKVVVQPGETLLVRINYDNSNGRVRLELTNESGQFVYDRVTQAYRWSAAAYHLPTSASGPETVLIHVKLTFGYVPKYTLSYQRHPKKFCRNDSLEGKGGNDTPGTSTGIAAEETSLLFGGLQICPGDIDYYVFGVSDDGKDLTISIPTNGRGRIRAQLLDSTQKVISETVGDGTLQIIKPLLTKGLYYLRIRGVDAQGVDDDSVETLYGIDITLKTQACIDWLETDGGNNTLAKATGVTQKEFKFVDLRVCAFDEDWLTYVIDQNRGLELLLTYNFVTANSVPLSVEVYDESEQKILTCTVGGTQDTGCTISDDPNNASIKQIKVSLTGSTVSSTRVYIRVARADTSTDTVNYELKLTPNFTVQCVDDNLEDDDTRQTAKTLTVPQESWQAQTPEWVYCTSDAADWKKIDLEAGDVLSVDLVHFISSTLPEPLSITLYDKDGSVVANGLRENPLSGFPATLGYGYSTWLDSGSSTITISGTYYLEIKPKDPGKKKDTSYKLTTHVVKNTDLPCGSTNAADGEPNNTPLNARTISSGVNYTSLSLCKNNPDWFVSTISTPKVDIKLTFDSAVSNVEVLVLTPTLDVLTTKVLTGETSFTYTTSAEGTYFVGVRPQAGYSSTTGYSLELAPR